MTPIIILLLAGYLIAFILHRSTLSTTVYLEKHKLWISIVAYTPFLFFTALVLLPTLLVTNTLIVTMPIKILILALVIILLFVTIFVFVNKWGPKQSYMLKQFQFSAMSFLIISILTVCLSYWIIQTSQSSLTQIFTSSSSSSTPATIGISWIETHPETAKLITALLTSVIGLIGTIFSVWVVSNKGKNK